MIYHIMWRDEPVADVDLSDDHKEIRLTKIMPPGLKQPFSGGEFNIRRFYNFLKDRCYEDGRADLQEILAQAGMTENNPYQWVRLTHGVTWDDFFWIKVDDEQISFDDVRMR